MHKRVTAAAAASVLIVGLTACSGGGGGDAASGEQRVFKVAFNQSESHPQAQAILALSDELEAKSDGQYSLELYPDATLGTQEATIEQIQSGTIDFAFVAGSLLESYSPDIAVVNLPYIYESPEHQTEVLNDEAIVGDLYESLSDDNIEVLAAAHAGIRNMYTDKPIKTPADLAGYKIRVIGSDTNVKMLELMGGIGAPMAMGEVYTAIQSGVIDGAENNEVTYFDASHYEVAPFYSATEHLMLPDFFIASSKTWDSLDEETRDMFQELLDDAVLDVLDKFAVAAEESQAKAEEGGAEFIDADADAFREAVLPLHEEVVTTPAMQEIYDAIESARG
jgi:tripartite ATP-independent transporter DctP family solute receptor